MTATDHDRYDPERAVPESVALLDAATRADVSAVRRALGRGADVNAVDDAGRTAVTNAIAGDSWENVDVSDPSFRLSDRLLILRLLLDHVDISLKTLNGPVRGVSPLSLAAWLDLREVVQLLLEDSYGMVSVNGMDTSGATPLMYAARDGRLEVVRCLLASYAKLDYRDANHRSAIQYALRHPHVLWLFESTLCRYRMRAFISKIGHNAISIPQDMLDLILISPRHVLSKSTHCFSYSSQDLATSAGTLVQSVLASDSYRLQAMLFSTARATISTSTSYPPFLVNYPDSTGWSPIHYCVSMEEPTLEILDALYFAGADVGLYTTSGHETPLHCLAHRAKRSRSAEHAASIRSFILHLVRQLHAPLSARDHNLNTCFHVAAEHGRNIDVLSAFLACDPTGEVRKLQNSSGLTALQVCAPDMLGAFGVDVKPKRPSSSTSIRTIRPSTSTSVQSMPPPTTAASSMINSSCSSRLPERKTITAKFDCGQASRRILNSLRYISDNLVADPVDLHKCRAIMQAASDMSDRLLAHLRICVSDVSAELSDARRSFELAHGLYREVKALSMGRPEGGHLRLDDARDSTEHARRRTTDSNESDATAITEGSYVLVSRGKKWRSMTDLPASLIEHRSFSEFDSFLPPLVPPIPAVTFMDTQKPPVERNIRFGSLEKDSVSIRRLSRQRSTTFPESTHPLGKDIAMTSTARLKAWLIRKIKPEAHARIPPARDPGILQSPEPTSAGTPSRGTFFSFTDGAEASRREMTRYMSPHGSPKALTVAYQDLLRIEKCLDATEQSIGSANTLVSKVEIALQKVLTARLKSLELVGSPYPRSHARGSISESYVFVPSLPQDQNDDQRSSHSPTSVLQRPRAQSAGASITNESCDDGVDGDIQDLGGLLLSRVEASIDDAEEEVERTLLWLRIVKDILRGLRTRTV
ncbi:ankyrin [Laetiporus sulphureus 93-53]|uniref:Ankyrin n=1 Tax=Laetiporus sulphureus 93-53 TaxID=1314785 RepID=A0A165ES91_9APHY|nr:ankyrin [Laetiporus sulphureus 93-53]KZT07658.1 ankyrin [Laetiporus sulphureus 93-53]